MGYIRTIILMFAMSASAQPLTQGELGFNFNTPPVASEALFVVPWNARSTNQLVASDREGPVTYSITSNPTNGTLSNLDVDAGTVVYLPNTNYVGPDYFTFRVIDRNGFVAGNAVNILVFSNYAGCDSTSQCITYATERTLYVEWTPPPGQCMSLPPPFNTLTNTATGIPISPPGQVCNPPFSLLYALFIVPGPSYTLCITNPCVVSSNFVNFVPTMTGNTSPAGTASFQRDFDCGEAGTQPWKAFDGDDATYWATVQAGTTWIQYQFTNSFALTAYALKSYNLKQFTLQGSPNGSSWTTLDTQSSFIENTLTTNQISNATPYQYYRLNVQSNYRDDCTRVYTLKLGVFQ